MITTFVVPTATPVNVTTSPEIAAVAMAVDAGVAVVIPDDARATPAESSETIVTVEVSPTPRQFFDSLAVVLAVSDAAEP